MNCVRSFEDEDDPSSDSDDNGWEDPCKTLRHGHDYVVKQLVSDWITFSLFMFEGHFMHQTFFICVFVFHHQLIYSWGCLIFMNWILCCLCSPRGKHQTTPSCRRGLAPCSPTRRRSSGNQTSEQISSEEWFCTYCPEFLCCCRYCCCWILILFLWLVVTNYCKY